MQESPGSRRAARPLDTSAARPLGTLSLAVALLLGWLVLMLSGASADSTQPAPSTPGGRPAVLTDVIDHRASAPPTDGGVPHPTTPPPGARAGAEGETHLAQPSPTRHLGSQLPTTWILGTALLTLAGTAIGMRLGRTGP